MNGTINITSQLGFGTSFTIQIPLKVSDKSLKIKEIQTPGLLSSQNQMEFNKSKTTDSLIHCQRLKEEQFNSEVYLQNSQTSIIQQAIFADIKEQYSTQAKELLSSFFQLTSIFTGNEIVRAYKKLEYCSLVILCHKYPDMDGFQVADQLRKANCKNVKKKNQVHQEQKKRNQVQEASVLYIAMVVNDQRKKTMFEALDSQIDHIFVRDELNKEIKTLLLKMQAKRDKMVSQNPMVKSQFYVLIIEDNVFVQELLETLFLEQNLKSIISVNGQDGYEKFVKFQSQIQLVIVDYEMPILSGFECIKKIRKIEEESKAEQKSYVPIILSSGNQGQKYESEAMEVGAMFVTKPITNQKIREIIKEYNIKPN